MSTKINRGKKMEHEQGTREWLEWRVQGIGSSDGPVLMGKSEYKTTLELWDEKFNKTIIEEKEQTFIQKKGHRVEALVRSVFELWTNHVWSPRLMEHVSYPWMRASFDGFNSDLNEGWECKYMGKELYLNLINTSLSILTRIPPQYLDQICHQFLVSGARAIWLSGLCDSYEVDDYGNKRNSIGHLRIPMTPELNDYIQTVYAPTLFSFRASIERGERPIETHDDVVAIDDKALGELVEKYAEFYKEQKSVEKRIKICKDLIFKHPSRKHSKMEYMGHRISLEPGRMSVDYKEAFETFTAWIYKMKTALLNGETNHAVIGEAVCGFPDKPDLGPYTSLSSESFKVVTKKDKPVKEKKDEPEIIETYDPNAIESAHRAIDNIPIMPILPGHRPAKKVNDDPFDFENPITRQKPRSWNKKTLEQKADYLIREGKKKTYAPEFKKIFLDFAEVIQNEIEKRAMLEKAPTELDEKLDTIINEPVTIGGVTFQG